MGNTDCKLPNINCSTQQIFTEDKVLLENEPLSIALEKQIQKSISKEMTKQQDVFIQKKQWRLSKEQNERKKKTDTEMKQFIQQLLEKSNQAHRVIEKKRKQNLITRYQAKENKKVKVNFERFLENQKQFLMKKQQFITRERQIKQLEQLSLMKPFSKANKSLRKSQGVTLRSKPVFPINFSQSQKQINQQNVNTNIQHLISKLQNIQLQPQPYCFNPPFPENPGFQQQPVLKQIPQYSNNQPILQVQITINGRLQKIFIKQNDNIDELAVQFLQRHNLPHELKHKLIQTIGQNLMVQ